MNSTHAHFNISAREIGAILDSLWLLVKCACKSVKRLEIIPFKREATWNRLSAILYGRVGWRPVVSIWMTSPFSDSFVFTIHTRKQRFQKASFSNRSTLESVNFRMTPFSVIVFGVVVWTIAVSGAKQFRFRLKTD